MELNNIKKVYSTIDSILEEVCLSEEMAIQNICILLEKENIKFGNQIINEVVLVLRQWNKIPVNEIKIKTERLLKQYKIFFDK